MFSPRLLLCTIGGGLTLWLGSACAGRNVASFAGKQPALNLLDYYHGETHSWGVFEARDGAPTQIIHTQTNSHRTGETLHFEQEIEIESGKSMHRSWEIRKLDAHHYEATGTGIIGVAKGEEYGNALRLEFTLDALPGNVLGHVRMTQWLYLQPDGRTLVNRATIRKAGFIVAELTEHFVKDR